MSVGCGPYVQMGKLAQQMASRYEADKKLALQPLLAHYMDEVEVNVASDKFDHSGFMDNIRGPLQITADGTTEPRRKEFLMAVVDALNLRMQQP